SSFTTTTSTLHLMLPPLRRPPLTPTLFPYTTLFRSNCGPQFDCSVAGWTSPPAARTHPRFAHHAPRPRAGTRGQGSSAERLNRRDRKSKRLNSSHGSISYAVFCSNKY